MVFALARESLFFRRAFPTNRRLTGAPCRAYECGPPGSPFLVLETGVGAAAAARAMGWLLEDGGRLATCPTIPLVISAGFCGALRPSLRVGDLVLATEVVDTGGEVFGCDFAPQGVPGLHRGRAVTAASLVATPEGKADLARRHQALAVDMEAAVLARLCRARGVAFGCLRAVSDDADAALSPRLVELLSGGRVSPLRLAGALLRRPALAGELGRLAVHTRRAARALAGALQQVLRQVRVAGPAG